MSGNSYSNISMTGGRAQFGDSYHYGPSQDERTFKTIMETLQYPEMNHRQEMLREAEEGTFDWAWSKMKSLLPQGRQPGKERLLRQ